MAAVSGVHRTIAIPYSGEGQDGSFDELALVALIPALVVTPANTLTPAFSLDFEEFWQYSGGSFHFARIVRVEFLLTVAGDAVVAGNLSAFQTSLGKTIATWSETISYGW